MARKRTPPGDAPAPPRPDDSAGAPAPEAPPPDATGEPKVVDMTVLALLQMLGSAVPASAPPRPGATPPLPAGMDAAARVADLTVADFLRLVGASRGGG